MGRYSKRSISPVLFAPRRVILPLAVLFAFGEWYLLRKFSGRIEYHCEAKPNNITTRRSRIISLRRSRNITHIAKRESFAKYLFALLSFFSANSSAPWGCRISGMRIKNIELLQVLANAVRPYGNSYRGFTITKPKTKTLVGANCVRPRLPQLFKTNNEGLHPCDTVLVLFLQIARKKG